MMIKSIDSGQQDNQKGAALVVALLVVALVATMAAALVSRLNLDIHRTNNSTSAAQGLEMAKGVEAWALGMLATDAKQSKIDTLDEDWTLPLPLTQSDGGEVAGRIIDLSGRFNLNDLIDKRGVVKDEDRAALVRLFVALEIKPGLVDVVSDWLDKDTNTRFPAGAEDLEYLSEDPPYRSANRVFTHTSELLLLKNFDAKIYARLLPFVTTLPSAAKVNVNTVSATVLMAWIPGLTESEAQLVLGARESGGFASVKDFFAHPTLSSREFNRSKFSVSSHYFISEAWVTLGPVKLHMQSLLMRTDDGKVGVLERNLGGNYWVPELVNLDSEAA